MSRVFIVNDRLVDIRFGGSSWKINKSGRGNWKNTRISGGRYYFGIRFLFFCGSLTRSVTVGAGATEMYPTGYVTKKKVVTSDRPRATEKAPLFVGGAFPGKLLGVDKSLYEERFRFLLHWGGLLMWILKPAINFSSKSRSVYVSVVYLRAELKCWGRRRKWPGETNAIWQVANFGHWTTRLEADWLISDHTRWLACDLWLVGDRSFSGAI